MIYFRKSAQNGDQTNTTRSGVLLRKCVDRTNVGMHLYLINLQNSFNHFKCHYININESTQWLQWQMSKEYLQKPFMYILVVPHLLP